MYSTGPIIKKLRIARRMKQSDMASRLNISTPAYSNIEIGKVDIKIDRVFQLAEIFRVTPAEIISDTQQGTQIEHQSEIDELKKKIAQKDLDIIRLRGSIIDLYEEVDKRRALKELYQLS